MNRQIEFCSHVGNLSLVRHFVRQFLGARCCDESELDLLVLGVDEACTNVIRHAYGNREDQLICLRLESLDHGVRFRLRDFAEDAPDPATFVGRPLEEVRPGGLGMHFIRRVFDRVDFLRRRDGTELVLTKILTPRSGTATSSSAPPPCAPGESNRAEAA